jgi:hypothetical protein
MGVRGAIALDGDRLHQVPAFAVDAVTKSFFGNTFIVALRVLRDFVMYVST